MSLTLRLKETSTIPIGVENVLPETVEGLSAKQVADLPIKYGNRTLPLGSLFEVQTTDAQADLVFTGDLRSVHWIAAGMTRGHVVVQGCAGRHLGSRLAGGSVRVAGDVGDFLGCEMTGGSIRIDGHAGDWVGSAYPGSKFGVNRGLIVVHGNTGRGVAMAMRRGTICIGGNTGPLAGWNMRAGTVLIAGETGSLIGKGMVRGTVVLAGQQAISGQSNRLAIDQLPPTFTYGGSLQSPAINVLARWAKQQGLPIDLSIEQDYSLFHGDHLRGGRGEILIAAGLR